MANKLIIGARILLVWVGHDKSYDVMQADINFKARPNCANIGHFGHCRRQHHTSKCHRDG